MTTARDHSFVSDAPRFDFGGLAFGDRAGGASHLSRFASQPYGRSSTGPRFERDPGYEEWLSERGEA